MSKSVKNLVIVDTHQVYLAYGKIGVQAIIRMLETREISEDLVKKVISDNSLKSKQKMNLLHVMTSKKNRIRKAVARKLKNEIIPF